MAPSGIQSILFTLTVNST